MSATSTRNRTAFKAVSTAIVADAYIRLSDLRDTDLTEEGIGKTFADREKALREFAARLGWTIDRVVVENDVAKNKKGRQRGASAFKRRRVYHADGTYTLRVWRPGFQSILDGMRSGRINALLAEDLDRMMRDPRDLEDLIDIAAEHRVNARSLSGSLTFTDGGTDSEITMARVMVTMGNKSSRDTGRRVAASRKRKAHANEYGGGRRPYGFESDGVTKRWDECQVIVTASRRVVQGIKLAPLVQDLIDAEVPTVTGAAWSSQSLRDILLRPRNGGIQVYQGQEIGHVPARQVIPVDLYRAVVRTLTDPARTTTTSNAPRWLGSCLYRCGKCDDGTTCVVTSSCGRTPSYICRRRHLTRIVQHVDTLVVGTVLEMLSQPEAAGLLTRRIGTAVDTEALRAESATIQCELGQMSIERMQGKITAAQMHTATEWGNRRLAMINEQLASVVVESPLAPLISATDVRKAWDAQPLSVRRAAIESLVDVTILAGSQGRKIFDPRTVRITPKADYTIPTAATVAA